MSQLLAHRDLASRIHVRNAAESGQTRTDVNDPEPPSVAQLFRKAHIPAARAEASTARASESSHGLG
jgi:hypothetical protein